MELKDVNIVNNLIIDIGRTDSEKATLYKGLYFLFNALDIMAGPADLASKKWCRLVLEDFYEIYKSNPDISDADAMISFIKMEKPIDQLEELERLPLEVRDRLDFHLDENLKPFVEHYAKEYAEEDPGTIFNGGQNI